MCGMKNNDLIDSISLITIDLLSGWSGRGEDVS
jgi:hypothetical protein